MTSRAFPKFESYGMLETAASVGWSQRCNCGVSWNRSSSVAGSQMSRRYSLPCCYLMRRL